MPHSEAMNTPSTSRITRLSRSIQDRRFLAGAAIGAGIWFATAAGTNASAATILGSMSLLLVVLFPVLLLLVPSLIILALDGDNVPPVSWYYRWLRSVLRQRTWQGVAAGSIFSLLALSGWLWLVERSFS